MVTNRFEGPKLEEIIKGVSHDTAGNETLVTTSVVMPVLQCLGWSTLGVSKTGEVDFERPISNEKKSITKKADIALLRVSKTKKKCVAVIEVKAFQKSLDGHVKQLAWYATYEKADIFVLTNGLEWRLYLRPNHHTPPPFDDNVLNEFEFTRFYFADPYVPDPHQVCAEQLRRFLGKKNTYTQESKKLAKEQLKVKKGIEKIHDSLSNILIKLFLRPEDDLIDYLTEQIAAKIRVDIPEIHIRALVKDFGKYLEEDFDYHHERFLNLDYSPPWKNLHYVYDSDINVFHKTWLTKLRNLHQA